MAGRQHTATLDLRRKQREREFHDTYFDGAPIRHHQGQFYSKILQDCPARPCPGSSRSRLGRDGPPPRLWGQSCRSRSRLLWRKGLRGSVPLTCPTQHAAPCAPASRRRASQSWKYVAVMDAEQLGFPSESFHVVFGRAIAHHLDLEAISEELFRTPQARGTGSSHRAPRGQSVDQPISPADPSRADGG